jgi:hypothetical protein
LRLSAKEAKDMTARFELWRQDDHGGRFLVGRSPDRVAAEMVLAGLTRGLHKQMYWIDELPGGTLRPPSGGEG